MSEKINQKIEILKEKADQLADQAAGLSKEVESLATQASDIVAQQSAVTTSHDFMVGLTVLVLAVIIGYYVIWRVTPALHSPLMAVTNAISSVIIVGALIAAGSQGVGFSTLMGFLAVTLASINIFGGFVITQRMLNMYKKK